MDIIHIVIDIDNTILDGTTTHLKYCNLVTGKNIKKEEIEQFHIYHYYNWTMQDFEKVYEQYGSHMHEESLPLPHAIETIKELKKNNRITFMTARPEKYRLVTENWLNKYNIPFDQLIMTEGKLNRFIKEGGDILIDDSPHYAEQFSINKLPMIIMDYPYNRSMFGETIIRVSSWKEIDTAINSFDLSSRIYMK